MVCDTEEVSNLSHCYFLQKEVLLRKWVPQGEHFIGDPIYHVVVPQKFHDVVLQIAHDDAGHLGVRKAIFYWPHYVSAYIWSCHTCQLTGNRMCLASFHWHFWYS